MAERVRRSGEAPLPTPEPDHHIQNDGADDLRVLTRKEFSAEAGFSLTTLDRLIKRGEGPPIVKLSPRRNGIRRGAGLRWIKSREVA